MTFRCTIPGEPVSQGRPRAFRMGAGIRLMDPAKSRSWKGVAQVHYQEAMARAGLSAPAFSGPVTVVITAVFTCPKSHWRKREPLPRRPYMSPRNDWDNIGKAVCDAGNGLLWGDDGQVTTGTVHRVFGAQGEAPHVLVEVTPLDVARVDPVAAFGPMFEAAGHQEER